MDQNWNKSAKEYSAMASSRTQDAYEYEVNFPSILTLCPPHSQRVLDLGCGSGDFTSLMRAQFPEVQGCDGSEEMLEIAREKNPKMRFFLWNLEHPCTEVGPASFDLIVAKLVFMFVEHFDQAAQECTRILSPGGSLVISVIHPLLILFFNPPVQNNVVSSSLPQGYFSHEKVIRAVKGNPKLTFAFIHRTVSEYVNVFTGQGLMLARIDEPVMQEDFLARHPEWQERRFIPQRLNFKFVKL